MKRLSVYLDTSVIGGCLDEEFAFESRRLLRQIAGGRWEALISELVLAELADGPDEILGVLAALPRESWTLVERSAEADELRDAYLAAGVVSEKARNDAAHVAIASVAAADVIVSWNFRHIVHFQRILGYHSVNIRFGYPLIDIRSPREVYYEDENL